MKRNLLCTVALAALLLPIGVHATPRQLEPGGAQATVQNAPSEGQQAYDATFARLYSTFKRLGDPGQAEAFRTAWEHKFDQTGELTAADSAEKAIEQLEKVGQRLGCPEQPDYKCLYVRAVRAYREYHYGLDDGSPHLNDPEERAQWGAQWLHKFDNTDLFTTEAGAISAIRQMRDSLGQRFDYVQDPAKTQSEQKARKAHFGGIGLPVEMRNQKQVVIGHQLELVAHEPAENSPAYGLVHYRDVFVKLDGELVENMTLEAALSNFKGKPGSHLKVTVRRNDAQGQPQLVDLDLIRNYVPNPMDEVAPHGDTDIGVWLEIEHLDDLQLGAGFELLAHEPFDAGPAKGKIKNGDLIVAVDGESLSGKTIKQAVEKLRGPDHSIVKVTVQRNDDKGQPHLIDIAITRSVIQEHGVHFAALGDGISQIKVDQFEGLNVAQDMATAIARAVLPLSSKALKAKQSDPMSLAIAARFDALRKFLDAGGEIDDKTLPIAIQAREIYDDMGEGGGVFLDLGNNPGGDLGQALAVAAMLLPQGETMAVSKRIPGTDQIVIEESFLMPNFELKSTHPAGVGIEQTKVETVQRVPLLLPAKMALIVRVNPFSASGSEIVAGALQANHRAKVISKGASHGKGNGQVSIALPYGVSLHVTDFEFFPGGMKTNWQGVVGDIQEEPSTDGGLTDPQRDRAVVGIKKENELIAAHADAGQDSLARRHAVYGRLLHFRANEDAKPPTEQDPYRLD